MITDGGSTARDVPRLVHLGLLPAADERDPARLQLYRDVREQLLEALTAQFPQFQWQIAVVNRHRFSPLGAIDPLTLLEFAVQEKIAHRLDYVLALVPNELSFRDRAPTWGVPSSALEAGVISTGAEAAPDVRADSLAAMSLHLLGHLWGLEHCGEGPMRPLPARAPDAGLAPFPADQQRTIVDRLDEVADARIEEERRRLSTLAFYWRTFTADPRGILTDLWGYAPWKLPFRLGRLTAGAVTFMVILLLTAETWEVGVNFAPAGVLAATVAAIPAAAAFLFVGQNLAKMSGSGHLREQLVRTRLVLYGSLLAGMASLWVVLSIVAFLVGLAMPDHVLVKWLTERPDAFTLARYSAFMATLGLLGGALGGNLEDEGNFKAKFLFDEEV